MVHANRRTVVSHWATLENASVCLGLPVPEGGLVLTERIL